MIYIGIDPGRRGGFASITAGKETAIEMPLMPDRKEIDTLLICQILTIHKKADPNIFCILEKAQSMPGQGSTSTFNYGVGYGEIRGVLKAMSIPFEEVRPNVWKKEFSLVKKDKKASATIANKLFPKQNFRSEKGRLMDGKAEALLLAEYAKRKYNKDEE